ncbi:MAG: biopolymer transporter ExbD [Bacteroidales bacterium]|jgi:biopolymer transport protein ExbD|nr:biopolymer transporter ExbD [Bacteroidales bacterium]NLB02161.1 biopolymer transporter ExbD [Bacteroidales bacterium]
MSKFKKSQKNESGELNASSMSDIIFMLLFFFMTVTSMKEVDFKVKFDLPQATELTKLEKKSLVTYIYIGPPTVRNRARMGSETRIQLNDKYAEIADIQDYIAQEKGSMKEEDQPYMTVSLKIDRDTKMGIVNDVKQALRKAYALKISYAANKRQNEQLR